MNWRRGLFKLWLLLSVVWVSGVSFVAGNEFIAAQDQWDALTAQIVPQSLVPVDCDASCCWQDHCWPTITEFREKHKPNYDQMSDVDLYVLLFERAGIKWEKEPSLVTALSKLTMLGLGPSIGVLILGAALVWAFKGFHPSK